MVLPRVPPTCLVLTLHSGHLWMLQGLQPPPAQFLVLGTLHPSALDPALLAERGSVPTTPHPWSTFEGSTAEPRIPAPGSIPGR